ncbi:MAG: CDP-glycerol glycerophosphotransferase family protein [Bacteroidales bacterium]
MEAIIINRKLADQEEEKILQILKQDKNPKLFANVELPASLDKYCSGPAELSSEEKREINYRIIDKVIDFGEMKIDNRAITDILTFEKVSIWHYHKFRTYFSIRNLYYEIELINQLGSKYSRIYYYSENVLLQEIRFESAEINICTPQVNRSNFSKKTAFHFSIFFIIRALLGVFQLPGLKNKKHIVIDHAIKQTCLNLHTLQPEPGNYNLQYLFDELDDQFIILNDLDIPKFQVGADFVFDTTYFKLKENTFFGEWVLFRGLFSGKIRKDLKSLSVKLIAKYKQIESETNDPVFKLAIQQLISLHASSKLFLFKYLSYKKFFTKYHFNSITSIDENSARIKSILDAAKAENINTIGIQHGTIHELHPAYIYTNEDQQRNIVPDYTMVWGKYWSEFLIEHGNYKADSLEITGQIRTDIIHKLKTANPHDYLKIPEASRIVVFASQPQRDPKLRYQAAFDVFTSVKDLADVHLVVKLHPAEKNDFGYYHNIAQKAGCANYQILEQFDLYLLISLSEIMITCFSTVGAETVYFNKPLIILDHLKQDIQGYLREGIAFQAANSQELQHYLQKLIAGDIHFNETAYKKYIEKYAFKIDGKVADRIIHFINNLNP